MKHTIILPDLGQTTGEAKILKWQRRLGEKIESGTPLLEVETDKATMEVESYAGGYLREMLVREGDIVGALLPIAILTDTADEDYEIVAAPDPDDEATTKVPLQAGPADFKSPSLLISDVKAVPAARTLAKALGIELHSVIGTGPGGLISRKDVEQHAERLSEQNAASDPSIGVDHQKAARAMAAITTESAQTIPHFYVSADIDLSGVLEWRESWNAQHPGLKASINAVFVRATSRALLETPELNAIYANGHYERKSPTGDTLIVVALEGRLELVPFRNASDLNWESFLLSLNKTLDDAKSGRLSSDLIKASPRLGLSNLGMFKVKQFTAIIPPGCTGILAIGAVRDWLTLKNQQIEVRKICTVTLSADHRMVDGVGAAQFLERVQFHLNSL